MTKKKEIKEIRFEKTYFFPRQNKTVRATSLEEANEILLK